MKKQMLINLFLLGMGVQGMCAENLSANREIPIVSSVGSVSVANFNLNRQGNTIVARPGEKIFSTLNFSCDTTSADPHTLYQLVVGYENIGPQKCVLNELGYRVEGKEGILSFFCVAPEEPGSYEVQCNVSSARSSAEALSLWDQNEEEANTKVTIGRIIVK